MLSATTPAPADSTAPGWERWLPFVAALVLVVSASVPFWNRHPDEETYVQIALESRAAQSWLDARYFGELNFFKPPLLYAALRASFAVFGTSPFAARVPGLLALFACALLASRWARQLAGARAGTVTALLVLFSPMAVRFGHLAMMDVPLALCFLGAAVLGRDVAQQRGTPLLLTLTVAGTLLLKGPALAPLVLGAFALEAGRSALKPRWLAAAALGLVFGSSWLAVSWLRHGDVFVASFLGTENLGKFSQPWRLTHVLGLVAGVVLCAAPYRLWPVGFFGAAAAVPPFARWFPVLCLAFYALPSVTFPQYMICVLPAVALSTGVIAHRTPRAALVAHVALFSVVSLAGAWASSLATSPIEQHCRQVVVEGDKPGAYQLWLQRDDGEAARCTLRMGPCAGKGREVRVPQQAPRDRDVLTALETRDASPIQATICLMTD